MELQGIKRRLVHITLFEVFAILLSGTGMALLSDANLFQVGFAAIASSIIAVTWNFGFNLIFEAWERRQPIKGRSLKRRAVHAVAFEIGLTLVLVPLFAFVLEISLIEAFLLDIGLILFFLVYTFSFNLAFDRIFGLPASALPDPG